MSGKLAAAVGVLAFALVTGAPGAWAQTQDNGGWQEREQDDALLQDDASEGVDETRIEELREDLQGTEERMERELDNIRNELDEDHVDEVRLEELQERLDEHRDEFQSQLQELRSEMDQVAEEARIPREDEPGLSPDETRIEERVLDDLRQAEEGFADDLQRAEDQLTEDVMELDRQIRGELEAVVPENDVDDAEEPGVLEEVQEAVMPDPVARPAIDDTWMAEGSVGLNQFTSELNEGIRTGFGVGARGIWNANEVIGAELGYVGGGNARSGTLDAGRWIVMNGVDAAARFSWVNESMFRPFAAGGLGFLHLNTVGRSELELPDQTIAGGDSTIMTVPVGVGVAVFPGDRLVVGGRFDYRFQTGIISNELPDGNNWTLGINAGTTF